MTVSVSREQNQFLAFFQPCSSGGMPCYYVYVKTDSFTWLFSSRKSLNRVCSYLVRKQIELSRENEVTEERQRDMQKAIYIYLFFFYELCIMSTHIYTNTLEENYSTWIRQNSHVTENERGMTGEQVWTWYLFWNETNTSHSTRGTLVGQRYSVHVKAARN